ncbi:MAG TPA: preprotein translocase subunit SecG [Verrucomicrobiae bacterium]|nr:preprotein translocase subunit SecG [Verrucomicrobiae bacterium]
MSLLIGFLTFVLVVTCLFLMLLILVQLPKKEAGAGLAFGAGTVDTLIGAGSGNALTKLTKYAATTFLCLAVLLTVLNAQRHQSSTRNLQQELQKKASAAPILPATSRQTTPSQPAVLPPVRTTNNPAAASNASTAAAPLTTNGAAVLTPNGQPQPLQLTPQITNPAQPVPAQDNPQQTKAANPIAPAPAPAAPAAQPK